MNPLNYDFSYLAKAIVSYNDTHSAFPIMTELDKFFVDIKCKGVKITQNIDNEFFGTYVKCMNIEPEKIMTDDDNYTITEYMLEIDSKLYEILTPIEIVAVIINEIKNIVSSTALDKFKNSISYYIAMNKMSINLNHVVKRPKIFELVYDESVNTLYSIFSKPTTEVIAADDYMIGCGLYEEFNSAIDKCKNLKESTFVNELTDRLLVMQWYLSVVNNMDTDTRYISTILKEGLTSTGSRLLRMIILNAITELEPMTDSSQKYYTSLTESAKKKSLFGQIKDSGLRSLEQDVYEYTMRIKNIEDESDALMLMRQLNNRINILEDYLNIEDLEKRLYDKWEKVLNKYYDLRDTLTKKAVYKQKMYGLFADYNVLQQMYMRGELNTIY